MRFSREVRSLGGSKNIETENLAHISNIMGKLTGPKSVVAISDLPKTRTGKIMRRILRSKLVKGFYFVFLHESANVRVFGLLFCMDKGKTTHGVFLRVYRNGA